MLTLEALGERIMILGPSNAGKSTLALALADKLDLPVIHLDRLQHLPDTDWEPRPEDEFRALHDDAILGPQWIMDGNYSRLMPQRFERATSVILLASNHWLRLGRYLKRSVQPAEKRPGHLEGGVERIKWEMIDWILFKTPQNTKRYAKLVADSQVPSVTCSSIGALKDLYKSWDLTLPQDLNR